MKQPVEVIDQRALRSKHITGEVPNKKLPEEVMKEYEILSKLGIENSTVKLIKGSIESVHTLKMTAKKRAGTARGLEEIESVFEGYKIIPYKALHEIAVDHKLVTSSVKYYEKPFPVDVVATLKAFMLLYNNIDQSQWSKLGIRLLGNTNCTICNLNKYTSHYEDAPNLVITAPASHFSFPRGFKKIGTEAVKVPASTKVERFPISFGTDPILSMPLTLEGSVYCMVIDAWDKEGDDERLRQYI